MDLRNHRNSPLPISRNLLQQGRGESIVVIQQELERSHNHRVLACLLEDGLLRLGLFHGSGNALPNAVDGELDDLRRLGGVEVGAAQVGVGEAFAV